MKVQLTRKLAECIDGIDLQGRHVGEVLELTARDARILLAEGWAIVERRFQSEPAAVRRRSDDVAVIEPA